MASSASLRSPRTLVLINRVNTLITSRGITREAFRSELNEFLPSGRKLYNASGLGQIFRWLDPTSNRWSEPKSEVILAMLKWIDAWA